MKTPAKDRPTPKVLLIGWDAADWKFARPLMQRGEMPTLSRLVDRGAHGNLATNRPILSPMLWNSIATGKRPFKHGIYGFTEPRPDHSGIRPSASTSRTCKALWNIASQSGLHTNVVGWYASHPAEPIRGVVVSNRYTDLAGKVHEPWPLADHCVHPPEMASELAHLRVHPGELGREVIEPFMPGLSGSQLNPLHHRRLGQLLELIAESSTIQSAATHLLGTTAWDLTCVYFEGIDRFAHAFMEFHPPQMEHVKPGFFEMYRQVMTGCYRFHDMMLHALIQAAGPDTNVVLLSDHGYHDDHLRPPGPAHLSNPVAWHRPLGMLAMAGPDVRPDTRIFGASILDIAPTVLTMLGLPIDRQMDGRPLLDALAGGLTPQQIFDWDAVPGDAGMHAGSFEFDPDAERAAMRQLIDLGYIDDPGDDQEAVRLTVLGNLQRKVTSCLDADRRDLALTASAELYQRFPEEPDAVLTYAVCLLKVGQIDQAQWTLEHLRIPDEPDKARPLLQMKHRLEIEMALARGDAAPAEQLAAELPAQPAAAIDILLLRGQLAVRARDADRATQAYHAVLDIDPSHPGAHDGVAQAALMRQDWQAAADAALRAIQSAFFLPRAHLRLGIALTRLKQVPLAIDALNVAVHQDPTLTQGHQLLADLYEQIGQPEQAHHARLRSKGVQLHDAKAAHRPTMPTTPRHDSRPMPSPAQPPDAPPTPDTVFIVSGLPRSGTSLMMQMLVAAGIPALTDQKRAADPNNPHGYFELEAVKRLKHLPHALRDAPGHAVKVIHALIHQLPPGPPYRVLWMDRDLNEVLASQARMLQRDGKTSSADPKTLRAVFQQQARAAQLSLHERPDTHWLSVPHRTLLQPDTQPQRVTLLTTIAEFIGADDISSSVAAMTAAIDPTLYRQRHATADSAQT